MTTFHGWAMAKRDGRINRVGRRVRARRSGSCGMEDMNACRIAKWKGTCGDGGMSDRFLKTVEHKVR